MKTLTCTRIILVGCVLLILYLSFRNVLSSKRTSVIVNTDNTLLENKAVVDYSRENVFLVVVVCGDRLQETLTMLKSAIMFSKAHLNFIVFAEDQLISAFTEKLDEWKTLTEDAFSYKVMSLVFPVDNPAEWRKLFKPCASQRLFLPSVLKDIDSILYVDTDTLFLTPVEDVWRHFSRMNSSQMAALAPEHEDPNVGWYNRFARHPYYGKLGVNSGVMLMNLTRMREFKWVDYVIPIYKKYKLKITWGDQDIINIIFHFHPDKLYIYSCRYNFRPDHCMYTSVCKPSESDGIAVLHGSRGFFHSDKQPTFQAVYRAFDEFELDGDLYNNFYLVLEAYLESIVSGNCGRIKRAFSKNVKKFIKPTDVR